PFARRTEASELTATTRTSPSAAASASMRTWPTWRPSKPPFVRTTRLPAARWARAAETAAPSVTTCPRGGFTARRSRAGPLRPERAPRRAEVFGQLVDEAAERRDVGEVVGEAQ